MAIKGSSPKVEEKKYKFVPSEQKQFKSAPSTVKSEEKTYRYVPPAPPSQDQGKSLKMIIFAIVIFFLILTVGGFLLLLMNKPIAPPVIVPNNTNQTNQTINQTTNITACNDSCYYDQAISSMKYEFCKNISSQGMAQDCFLKLSNASFSSCLDLLNKSQLKDCIIVHAKRNNDSKTCSYLKEPDASQCLAAVDPCYSKSGDEKIICLALSNKDYTICKGNIECVYNYSQSTGSTDACHTLTEKAEEYACRSLTLSTDECASLSLASQKDLCYQIYSDKTGNGNLCSRISNDSVYAVECLSHYAVDVGTYSVCDQGLSFNNRWHCYSNFSMISGNLSGCIAIDALATTSRFSCIYNFAKVYGDPNACDELNDSSQAITCYVGAIINNTALDFNHCTTVASIQWKNKCYTEYARLKNDSSFCDYITTDNERNTCLSAVG